MKIYFNILLFISTLLIMACTRTETRYYEDGTVMSEYQMQGDKFHGKSTWYHENGNPSMISHYKKGVLDGVTTTYFLDGKKESEENYLNGLKHGDAIKWHANGKVKEKSHFVQDTLHGLYEVYYKIGQMQTSGNFDRGLYDGKWYWWNVAGVKVGEADFKKGAGIQKGWHINGNIKRTIEFINNKKHGEATFFNSKGEVEKVIIYREGKVILEDEG